jgi:hypothetical protein
MLFNSYGSVLAFNLYEYKPFGIMQNIFEMWKPSFGVSAEYSPIFNWLQMPFYIFLLFYFLRKTEIFSWQFLLFLTITLTYGIIHGNARYREPFIMVLVIWFSERMTENKKKFDGYINMTLR